MPMVMYLPMIIGILICFTGIYFMEILEGLLGFVWGILGLMIVSAENGFLRGKTPTEAYVWICGIGLLGAILFIYWEKVMMFLSSFLMFLVFLVFLVDTVDSLTDSTKLLIAGGLSFVIALIMAVHLEQAVMLEAAITGSLLIYSSQIGGISYLADINNVKKLVTGGSVITLLFLVTIVAGFTVQLMIYRHREERLFGQDPSGGVKTVKPDKPNMVAAEKRMYFYAIITFTALYILFRQHTVLIPHFGGGYAFRINGSAYMWTQTVRALGIGVFEGALVHFIVHYKYKTAFKFQLLGLLWLPCEYWLMSSSKLGSKYSILGHGIKYWIYSALVYVLMFIMLTVLDNIFRSKPLNIAVMCTAAAWFSTFGIRWITAGFRMDWNYMGADMIEWIMIFVTATYLSSATKKNTRYIY